MIDHNQAESKTLALKLGAEIQNNIQLHTRVLVLESEIEDLKKQLEDENGPAPSEPTTVE